LDTHVINLHNKNRGSGKLSFLHLISEKYYLFLKRVFVTLIILLGIHNWLFATTYYISPSGSDNNSGTIISPFFTLNKAWTVITAGDTIYLRGGTYQYTSLQVLTNKNGTASDTIKVWAFPSEIPTLDFSSITPSGNMQAITVSNCSYIHFRGFRVTGLGQDVTGAGISWGWSNYFASYLLIENITVDHIGGYGFTNDDGSNYNYYLNCDAHHNADPHTTPAYDGANGFGQTGYNTSTGTLYEGCRAWNNSDDGFDLYGVAGFVIFKNCWAFFNGYDDNFNELGNGNGFKLGPTIDLHNTHLRTVTNCISIKNKASGYDENAGQYIIYCYNNVAYNNGIFNFAWAYHPETTGNIFRNNLSFTGENYWGGIPAWTHDHNSWDYGVTVTNADFISLDFTQLAAARKADGSLPDIDFLHLASGSDLIDAGINVGLPYAGMAPDMGAFEYNTTTNQPPIILNQSFQLNENSPNATLVGTVVASDPDSAQTLTYSILSGNTNNAFAISASTGALTVNNSAALNFEVTPSFALTIKVQDNGSPALSSQATIIVNLLNVNEPPVAYDQTFNVYEAAANGTVVGYVGAVDPDAGQILSWFIISGNTNNAFSINSSTGALSVNNSSAINYLTNPVFNLIVRVTEVNGNNLFDDASVTINVLQGTNQPPVILNQSFSIAENSANGTLVGTVVASDPDAGQILTYSILSGNTGSAFAINSSTGALTVNNTSALDFEINPSFALIIKVQDNGTGSLSSQATITVSLLNVNEAPVIANQAFSINENSANGTLVGTVVASDPDAGQILTYSILSGNTGSAFAINSSTGALTVNNTSALDFEINPSFALIIKVQDNGTGSLSSQATITVSLLDVNEAPVIANQAFSIDENSANGTLVGTVVASDPDAGQTLTYSILSGNTGSAFAINASTGVLTVNNTSALDFEVNPSFALIIKVQDNGTGSLSSQATITVSLLNVNEAPVIANQAFSINENSANGTLVGTVVASDPDAGQTLTYSILSGNTASAFAINSSTGALTVNNTSALDFEVNPSFALIIKVQDNGTGSLSSQATITVSLLDVNEAPVIANQAFSINENSANGTLVGTVVASDPDAGQTLTYSILSGNTGSAFAINASTGVLTVNNTSALDFEVNPSFALIIKVQDNGTGSLSSQATITVSLLDVNEAPVIANQAFSINENSANGTLVGTVVASDPDAGQTLTYEINTGNEKEVFSINYLTGEITVKNSDLLAYETHPIFHLFVMAHDNATEPLSASAIISIILRKSENSRVIYIDPTNTNDTLEKGSLEHPYDSWYDFSFVDGTTYLQKKGTIFKSINPILIDQKRDIILGSYGTESISVLSCKTMNSTILEIHNSQNCRISDLEFNSDVPPLTYIKISGELCDSIIIDHCSIQHAENGILSENVGGNLIVRYCLISENENGIQLDAQTGKFYYNQFIGNSRAIEIKICKIVEINNNTFFNNTTSSISSSEKSFVSIINNIFYLNSESLKAYQLVGSIYSDYNLFNLEKSSFINGFPSLSSWNIESGQDSHSIVANPEFSDISNFDLKLCDESPCINKGLTLNLQRDYIGTIVPQNGIPDIGCFEKEIENPINNAIPEKNSDTTQISANLFNINAFPNPTTGLVKINISKSTLSQSAIEIKIIDNFGRTILTPEQVNNDEIEVNLENQPNGVYFALIKINYQVFYKKIILHKY
jgi:hypothetical protein